MEYLLLILTRLLLVFWVGAIFGTTFQHNHNGNRGELLHNRGRSYRQILDTKQTSLVKQSIDASGMIIKKLDTMQKQFNSTTTDEQRENEQLIKLLSLPPDYNKFELPVLTRFGKIVPLPVSVGIRIRNIRAVDVLNEEIGMELDLITHWHDLAINRHNARENDTTRILDSGFLKEIWWPNLIFSRTVSVVRPDLHGSYLIPRPVRLSINPKTGEVEMSSRLVLKLYCPMNFLYYPADTQICHVRLRSYAESRDRIDLKWHINSGGVHQAYFFNRGHPNYDIHMHSIITEVRTEWGVTNTSSDYTYLQFSLSTRRKLSFHIMQTYVPSIFLVVITWLAFFIPTELLEARIGISMTILLTLTAMFASIKEYTPPVSYRKSIDTWMLSCIVFVFLTLFEFTFLMYLRYVNEKAQRKALESALETQSVKLDNSDNELNESKISLLRDHHQMDVEKLHKVSKLYRVASYTIETYGFITISMGFLIFNLAYWPWLLTYSNYGSFSVNFTYNEPIPPDP